MLDDENKYKYRKLKFEILKLINLLKKTYTPKYTNRYKLLQLITFIIAMIERI